MALSVFIKGFSSRIPAVNNLVRNATNLQFRNSVVLTPTLSREFSSFNRSETKHLCARNRAEFAQRRNLTHSTIWAAEKILSVALLGVIPACIAFPSFATDNILATAVVVHMHWGVESVVVDYIRPALFGGFIPKLAHLLVYVFSAFTLGGLIYFNYNDVGCAQAVKKLWAIKGSDGTEEQPDPKDKNKKTPAKK